jgi:CRP/FNR family transcriptional regulator, cyclic AMP receptor protein
MTECPFTKKIFVFQDLDSEEVEHVVSATAAHDFPAGAVILQEGEAGDSMFIMCQGEVEITKRLTLELDEDTPKERVMIRLQAQDGVSFGEMALLENEARSATVTALSNCRLMELHRDEFLDLIHHKPKMGVKILFRLAQLLSHHLRKTNQDVVKLTTALAISLGG